jgi:arginase
MKAPNMDNVSLIGLPFYTLSKYRCMATAVAALRSAGITETLRKSTKHFTDMGDCHLSEIPEDSGPPNLRNFPQFLHDTDAVQEMAGRVGRDDFVFCLGGECTLITGTLAGFKNRFKGKTGILWVDAHGDFNTPETTSSGFIGGMPLAFACGRGPKLTQNVEHARPLLEEENVVHLASRSVDPLESKAMSSSRMKVYPDATAHKEGILKVAADAAAYLADHSDWITCHLDVDSIDPTIIPAVNYPEPGGLTLEEVRTVVRALRGTGKLKVFNLTAYIPKLDQDQTSAQKLLTLTADLMGNP